MVPIAANATTAQISVESKATRSGFTTAALNAAAPAQRARIARRARDSRGTCLGSRRRREQHGIAAPSERGGSRDGLGHALRAHGLAERLAARSRAPRQPCRSRRPLATCRARAAASADKSWPLLKPPAISTSGPKSPFSAASVAPTFVPFESSTNVTPLRSVTRWHRCGKPVNLRSASSAASSLRRQRLGQRERGERVRLVVRAAQPESAARSSGFMSRASQRSPLDFEADVTIE